VAAFLMPDFFAADFLVPDFFVADFRPLDFRPVDFRAAARPAPRFLLADFAFFFAGMRISNAGVSRRRNAEVEAAAGRTKGRELPLPAP
jgi:hypothetical protein